jgi:hypothetical protein
VPSAPRRRRVDSYRVHHTQGNTFLGASNDPWDLSFDRGIRHYGTSWALPVPPAWRSITFCFALLGCRLSLHPLSDVPVAHGCDSSCGKIAESRYDPTAKSARRPQFSFDRLLRSWNRTPSVGVPASSAQRKKFALLQFHIWRFD